MNTTSGVSLSDTRAAEIIALSKREYDKNQEALQTTMVSTKFTPSDESSLKKGYRAIRSANAPDTYEITVPSDVASDMRRDWPYAVLNEGDARKQVGAVTIDQNGCAITKFSRSESGQQARRRFETGDDALSIAYLHSSSGRKPAAFSMRAVSDGKISKEADMSDLQEIARLGAKHGQEAMATKAIAENQPLSEFRSNLLDAISVRPIDDGPYYARETEGYSLGKAIRGQMSGKLDGIEAEVHQELSRSMPNAPRGVVVPNLLLNTRTTMSTSNVANLVESLPRGDMYIDRLQPASAVMDAGATMLSGLSKAISIPKETAELSASFVAEGSAIAESNLTIGSITMTPRRISSTASFTLEALVQSNPQIDNLIRTSLTRQIAQALDDAALEGDGVAPNPTGIVNTSGINTLTTTGSSTMTHAEALDALALLEEDNVPSGGAVFVCNPTDYATIAATAVDSGSGRFVIENGTILGRRVVQSTLAAAGTVVLGDYSHCMIGMFGGTDVVVDNVTEARSAKVLITQHQMADVAIRHAVAFCAITLTA